MTESRIEHVWLKRQVRKTTGMTDFITANFSESTLLHFHALDLDPKTSLGIRVLHLMKMADGMDVECIPH